MLRQRTTAMTGVAPAAAIAVSLWLALGLTIQAWVCARQWQHLGRLAATADGRRGDDARAIGYGRRRALFQWLDCAEGVVRVLIWLYAGALTLFFQPFANAGWPGAVAFVGAFMVIDQLLRQILPLLRWRWVERAYAMSAMPLRERLGDSLRRVAVQTVLAVAAAVWVLLPLCVMDTQWSWVLSTLLVVSGAAAWFWARPHLIEPLFNRFSALAPGELRTRLETMMQRCGVELEDVWVVDGSRRSRLANAYFAGLGRRKRVVLFDTLIARLEPAELEAVMAHELGHERCGHLRRYYGLQGGLLGGGFLVFGWAQTLVAPATSSVVWAIAAYVSLPLLAWPLQPWLAGLRRRYEYEADAYAVRYAERAALVSALERLFANNLSPLSMERWYAAFFATHPPAEARLAALTDSTPADAALRVR